MVEFYSEIIIRIAVFFYALWIGGLATTVFNRVPNEIPIGPTHKPCCNNCKKEIKFRYFFPILGYFFSGGKCVNCGMKIPKVYLHIELSILFYILILSTSFDSFDERFISKSLYGAFIITLMFIYQAHKQIKIRLVWMLVAFILLYRGYNYSLPKVIDLFIGTIASYATFSILRRHIQIKSPEFEMCVILTASLNYMVCFVFLSLAIFFKIIYSIPNFEKYKTIRSVNVVFIPLITALVMSLFF